jgi:hypothetical protein
MEERAHQPGIGLTEPTLLQAMLALPDTALEPDFNPPLMAPMPVAADFREELKAE